MHLFLFSYHYLFIIFFFLGIFYSSLSQIRKREQQGKHHSIGVVLSLPAENTSCFCIHIHINQKICEYSRVVFSFSSCIGQIWSRHYSYILILLFLRTRIECAYTYTHIQKGIISGIYTRALYDSVFSRLYLIFMDICSIG